MCCPADHILTDEMKQESVTHGSLNNFMLIIHTIYCMSNMLEHFHVFRNCVLKKCLNMYLMCKCSFSYTTNVIHCLYNIKQFMSFKYVIIYYVFFYIIVISDVQL